MVEETKRHERPAASPALRLPVLTRLWRSRDVRDLQGPHAASASSIHVFVARRGDHTIGQHKRGRQ